MISPIIVKTISIVLDVLECVFSPTFSHDFDICFAQRAGMKGISYTYFTTDNAKSARELVTILREAKAVVPPQLEEMAMYGGGGGGRGAIIPHLFIRLGTLIFILGRFSGGRGRGGGGGGYRGGGGGGYGGGGGRW